MFMYGYSAPTDSSSDFDFIPFMLYSFQQMVIFFFF